VIGTQANAAVYVSDSSVPQMSVPEATADTGSNDAVALSELQVTVFTAPNSAPALSAPDTRSMTLPLQLDEAVKVTVTPLMLVPLAVTAVHSFPTVSPAGFLTRNTSAHTLPSEELLLLLADGLVDAVGLVDTVALTVGAGLAEELAVVVAVGVEVAAEATATPTPTAASRTVETTAPLMRVRLRMVFPFRIFLLDATDSGTHGGMTVTVVAFPRNCLSASHARVVNMPGRKWTRRFMACAQHRKYTTGHRKSKPLPGIPTARTQSETLFWVPADRNLGFY